MDHRYFGTVEYSGKERRRRIRAVPIAAAPKIPEPAVPAEQTPGRHGVIRSSLPTLATYKTWSAKARTDWEQKDKKSE